MNDLLAQHQNFSAAENWCPKGVIISNCSPKHSPARGISIIFSNYFQFWIGAATSSKTQKSSVLTFGSAGSFWEKN